MTATRIYVAGLISLDGRLGDDAVRHNLGIFVQAATALRTLGYRVENPAECLGGPGWEWIDYMRAGISQLVYCNAVCLLPGWSYSRGAIVERQLALDLGFDVRASTAWGVSVDLPILEETGS